MKTTFVPVGLSNVKNNATTATLPRVLLTKWKEYENEKKNRGEKEHKRVKKKHTSSPLFKEEPRFGKTHPLSLVDASDMKLLRHSDFSFDRCWPENREIIMLKRVEKDETQSNAKIKREKRSSVKTLGEIWSPDRWNPSRMMGLA